MEKSSSKLPKTFTFLTNAARAKRRLTKTLKEGEKLVITKITETSFLLEKVSDEKVEVVESQSSVTNQE